MAKRLVCKTGTYVDREGNQKNKWTNIGVIMSNDNGQYLLMDATVNLAGILVLQNQMDGKDRGNVMVSIFDDDNRNTNQTQAPQQQQQSQAPKQDAFDTEDDIPF